MKMQMGLGKLFFFINFVLEDALGLEHEQTFIRGRENLTGGGKWGWRGREVGKGGGKWGMGTPLSTPLHASRVIQDFVFLSRKRFCIRCISLQLYNKGSCQNAHFMAQMEDFS